MIWEPVKPIIVRVAQEPVRETSAAEAVVDILVQSLGLTGALLLGAALLGLVLGSLFIGMRILLPQNTFNGETSGQLKLNLNPPAEGSGLKA